MNREDFHFPAVPCFLSRHPAVCAIKAQLADRSSAHQPVLVYAEPGAGATALAHWFHFVSGGPTQLICHDCATAPTGSAGRSILSTGLHIVVYASKPGTLYFDHLETLSGALQTVLARQLASCCPAPAEPGREPQSPRVIASLRYPPGQWPLPTLQSEELHQYLTARLVHLPPLRERRQDIALLANHFVASTERCRRHGQGSLSDDAIERLEEYPWPGNVRQLRQVVEAAVATAPDGLITPANLSFDEYAPAFPAVDAPVLHRPPRATVPRPRPARLRRVATPRKHQESHP
jgi:arginine utilization regulatory protein